MLILMLKMAVKRNRKVRELREVRTIGQKLIDIISAHTVLATNVTALSIYIGIKQISKWVVHNIEF